MATFHFELASPAKLVFSGDVEQVDVPGSEGDFGVLPGHAPLVAMLRPGIMTIYKGGEKQQIIVLGGFAEVGPNGPNGLTVLADMASAVEELDRAALAAQIEQLEQRVKEMEQGSLLDREIAKLDHFKALQAHMTGTAMH
jgi:F-type H+-transporting ATPase subunit epsilon